MARWNEKSVHPKKQPYDPCWLHIVQSPNIVRKRRRSLDASWCRNTILRRLIAAIVIIVQNSKCAPYNISATSIFASAFSMYLPKQYRRISVVRNRCTTTADRFIGPCQKFLTIHMLSSSSLDDASSTSTKTSLLPYQQYYNCLFDMQVPEGRCVGVQLIDVPHHHPNSIVRSNVLFHHGNRKHWLYDFLHPEEIQYGLQLNHEKSRQSFWTGRLAIRHALRQQSLSELDTTLSLASHPNSIGNDPLVRTLDDDDDDDASCSNDSTNSIIRNSILKDVYGRPKLPDGILGSISHKGHTGVALVRRMDTCNIITTGDMLPPQMGIGVDIEDVTDAGHRRHNVARKVLTPGEISNLGTLAPAISKEEEVLLRFSLKESVYKAMHPLICQYVSFQEAEIQPYTNGTATVTLNLKSGAHKTFASPIVAHWYRYRNYLVTTTTVFTSTT